MNELLAMGKVIPEIAQERMKWARIYRETRKSNPALARLLFKRVTIAKRNFAESFWNRY